MGRFNNDIDKPSIVSAGRPMPNHPVSCSVCGIEFVPELTYQVEKRIRTGANGTRETVTVATCSLDCFAKSHESQGRAQCEVCQKEFSVQFAVQVLQHEGRRVHVCSPACRRRFSDQHHGAAARPLFGGEPESTSPAPIPPLTPTGQSSMTWRRIAAGLNGPPQVLAIFNHKGGTGKTTTAVTLAAGLAARGRRVLLVDTDGQGNVAVSLGLESTRSLYHVLVMGLSPDEAILTPRPGLDVIPSNETLAAAELYLAGQKRRDRVLATRLAKLRASYDHILVDCSPSLSLLNQNALVFADGVLCPVACDYLSLVGVRQVLRTIQQVHRLLSHPVQLYGVLPTLYDARAKVCVEAYQALRDHFGERCFEPIRLTSRVKEAPSQARSLFEHAPEATATQDYLRVVERLLDRSQAQPEIRPSAAGASR